MRYVSLACMHCEDAPCVLACPTTALQRSGEPAVVRVDAGLCIGCHGCAIACPYGVPRFGADGRMHKCDLCADRVAAGLEPACVRVCPTGALRHGDPNALGLAVEREAAAAPRRRLTSAGRRTVPGALLPVRRELAHRRLRERVRRQRAQHVERRRDVVGAVEDALHDLRRRLEAGGEDARGAFELSRAPPARPPPRRRSAARRGPRKG